MPLVAIRYKVETVDENGFTEVGEVTVTLEEFYRRLYYSTKTRDIIRIGEEKAVKKFKINGKGLCLTVIEYIEGKETPQELWKRIQKEESQKEKEHENRQRKTSNNSRNL